MGGLLFRGLIKNEQPDIIVGDDMGLDLQWDLTSMTLDELCSFATLMFVGKVLIAASVVAFGPAAILEYVPTKRVDTGSKGNAGSPEGKTQRLLLSFAGGGLMAEAALHLLPHLFMPHSDSDDHHHPQGKGPADACTLIALGFAAAFAIDRLVGCRRENGVGSKLSVAAAKAMAVPESAAAAAAGKGESEKDKGGVEATTTTQEEAETTATSAAKATETASGEESVTDGTTAAVEKVATSGEPEGNPQAELTRYGNPRVPAVEAATAEPATNTAAPSSDAVVLANSDTCPTDGEKMSHVDVHHNDHGNNLDAGAYVTLAVDVLHNVIDGIGIGGAYALGGNSVGNATAVLKLIHELQHEVGDVTTLVQCGMSKHHAIHHQHKTAAGVFLGVAISLGTGVFPASLLTTCLALSAGATFQLASGTVLGPVLAIPAEVGGPIQAFLEVAALSAGAAAIVAVGYAERWAGIAD